MIQLMGKISFDCFSIVEIYIYIVMGEMTCVKFSTNLLTIPFNLDM